MEIRVEAADQPTTANAATVICDQFAAAFNTPEGENHPER